MAYNPSSLVKSSFNVKFTSQARVQMWSYASPDAQVVASAANYFSNALLIGMQPGDALFIYDSTNNVLTLYQISAVAATGATISAVSGGGGSSTGTIIPTRVIGGTTTADTAALTDNYIGWNSSALAAKTETSPVGPALGQRFSVKDVYGNAATYNITVSGAGVTFDGAASFVLNANKQEAEFTYDGVSNWMVS